MERMRKTVTESIPIQENFKIGEETNIVIPGQHTDYDSIVSHTGNNYRVRQTPYDIIKHKCKGSHHNFESRYSHSKSFFSGAYKRPLLLTQEKIFIVLPTHSNDNINCAWIVDRNIAGHEEYKQYSVVHFKDGQEVILDISYTTLKSQIKKAYLLNNDVVINLNKINERIKEGKEGYKLLDYL